MEKKQNILLIVSILGGRNFNGSRHPLMIEGKFAGQSMATDPVDGSEDGFPAFYTELGWCIANQRELSIHRLQKSPVKLEVSVLKSGFDGPREVLGYVVLEIQSKQIDMPKIPVWTRLLGSRLHGTEMPEILISLSLESSPPDNTSILTKPNEPNIIPRLLSDKSMFQLGSEDDPNNVGYSLGIIIAYAKNLHMIEKTPSSNSYHFEIELFGEKAECSYFHELSKPTFLAERITVRVCSSMETFKKYMEQAKHFRITLRSGEDKMIAETFLQLHPLIKPVTMPPFGFEGEITLRGNFEPKAPNTAPKIGFSVEFDILNEETEELETVDNTLAIPTNLQQPCSPPERLTRNNEIPEQPHITTSSKSSVRISDSNLSQSSVVKSASVSPVSQPAIKEVSDSRKEKLASNTISRQDSEFRFSLDLRRIEVLEGSYNNIILRYSYPSISVPEVSTSPPISVRAGTKSAVPKGVIETSFSAQQRHLPRLFAKPLVIEFIETREKQEIVIGTAEFSLLSLLKMKPVIDAYTQASMQQMSLKTEIRSKHKLLGHLYYVVSVVNLGLMNLQQGSDHISTTGETVKERYADGNVDRVEDYTSKVMKEVDEWKLAEKEAFIRKLKDMENYRLLELSKEWEVKDKECEMFCKSKVEVAMKREEEVRKAILEAEGKKVDLEKQREEIQNLLSEFDARILRADRDDHITEMEKATNASLKLEVERLKEEMKRMQKENLALHKGKGDRDDEMKSKIRHLRSEFDGQVARADQDAKKRVQDTFIHDLEIEQAKNASLKLEVKRLKEEMQRMWGENQALNRAKGDNSEEMRSKESLEARIKVLSDAKNHYKNLWQDAVMDLQMEKEERRKLELAEQNTQVSNLGNKLKENMNHERRLFSEIFNNVEDLRNHSRISLPTDMDGNKMTANKKNRSKSQPISLAADNEIVNLMDERDTLLRSGLYNHDNSVILDLDSRINNILERVT